eukprot:TRINITY_DN17488_c0_g1_i2.p3 TRINITY_DN17488_c0_g1~~TRINITY_DN17488_c0_g1_i2.p3  ORF type:complete len:127 (-),score=22.56 TRINITY_DN17488_c0_g1_i2:227-607(-)
MAHLETVDKCCALHMDIGPSNLRVEGGPGELRLSGLIDFADVMIGDPLMDFGCLLADRMGERYAVDSALEGYGTAANSMSVAQNAAVQVYAVWYLLWRTSEQEQARKVVHQLAVQWSIQSAQRCGA